MADPDWLDPCAVLAWLRPQYYQVAAGLQLINLRHGDTYSTFGPANLPALQALMRQLESECAVAQGNKKAKRRAFIAG